MHQQDAYATLYMPPEPEVPIALVAICIPYGKPGHLMPLQQTPQAVQ